MDQFMYNVSKLVYTALQSYAHTVLPIGDRYNHHIFGLLTKSLRIYTCIKTDRN